MEAEQVAYMRHVSVTDQLHLLVRIVSKLEQAQGRQLELLTQVGEDLNKLMSTVADLNTALSTLIADVTTALADIKADLVALAANQTDPTTATAINNAVAQLTSLDATIKAADPGPQPAPAVGS